MAKKANQEEMFPQPRIAGIENWIDKTDDIRATIGGLKEDLKNAEYKLREALHRNKEKCQVETSEETGTEIRYERGTYKASAKFGKETVTYTRAGEAKSKEPAADVPEDEGGGE